MTQNTATDRRTFIAGATGALLTAGLAGCSGNSDGGADEASGDSADSGSDDSGGSDIEGPDYGGWFDNVDNYDGTVDETGADEVTVGVGTEGNNGNYAFGPAAVAISPGTTVVWEWTGKGSTHNVVAEDGTFDSGTAVDEEGKTFEHTFEETGVYEYVCTPHEAMGMKGAVYVTE